MEHGNCGDGTTSHYNPLVGVLESHTELHSAPQIFLWTVQAEYVPTVEYVSE